MLNFEKFCLNNITQILSHIKDYNIWNSYSLSDVIIPAELTQSHIYYLTWFGDRPPAALAAVRWLAEN